jgi:membrane associated rhomboid family serine protease
VFYAIPLENKPSWRNPPWMTVLLILLNMLVFWGPQRSEENTRERAANYYTKSVLPELELPPFVEWLEKTDPKRGKLARRMLPHEEAYAQLLEGLQNDKKFLAKLRADEVIKPTNPQYGEWKRDRQQYEAMLPAPFTERWSQDYNKDAEFKPWTWITAAFLHGSTGHLLGNMLFLFLFGFSVELALGRGTYLTFYLLGAVGSSLLAGWAYAGKEGYGLGASGAISALMGMYAVMYRLRRIRFFYQLFFYFNYVTAPALLLLPAWIVNELMQHWLGGQGIAYMAHLGGLLTGAALMTRNRQVRNDERRRPLRCARGRRTPAGRRNEVRARLRRVARRRRPAPQRRRHAARLVQHRAAAARERRLPPGCAPHLPPARHRPRDDRSAAHQLQDLPRPGQAGAAPEARRHGPARAPLRPHPRVRRCRHAVPHPAEDRARSSAAGRHALRVRERVIACRRT